MGIASVISAVLAGIVGIIGRNAIGRWLGRASIQDAQSFGLHRKVLECPVRVRAFVTGSALAFAGMTAGMGLTEKFPDSWTLMGACMALTFGTLVFMFDVQTRRVLFDSQSVTFLSAWRADRTVLWEDFTKVSHSPLCQWFVFHTKDGSHRVYEFASGLREFFETLQGHSHPRPNQDH